MENILNKFRIKDYVYILLGSLLMALGTNLFFVTHDLVTGGVLGLGIIIRNFFPEIPLWLTNIIFNIPLFAVAILLKGKKLGVKSLIGMLSLTFMLFLTEKIAAPTDSLLLSCIYGGVLNGVGLGMVFMGFGSTGGTDLIAIIIQHFNKHISIGNVLRVVETIIVLGGAIVFGFEKALYAVIAVYLTTRLMDNILDGLSFARAVYIITDKKEEISRAIMDGLNRGVTSIKGEGMFNHTDKDILFSIVSPKELPKLKEVVKQLDERAFMTVLDAREVLGEGFKKNE